MKTKKQALLEMKQYFLEMSETCDQMLYRINMELMEIKRKHDRKKRR